MNEIIINPSLNNSLTILQSNPPGSMLLIGPKGSGKKTLINYFANMIAINKPGSVIIPLTILKDKKHIVLEQINDIKNIIKTKSNAYRIILIADAENMTQDVQNSLLKTLEEPNENVIFIFSSSVPQMLLDTVLSRVVKIQLIAPTKKQTIEFCLKYGISEQNAEKYYRICNGRFGLLHSLIKDNISNPILQNIEDAKELLSDQPKDRLAKIDVYSKDFNKTLDLLDALILICDSALHISAKNKGLINNWLARLDYLNQSYELVLKNVAIKLILTKLFLVL